MKNNNLMNTLEKICNDNDHQLLHQVEHEVR